MRQEAADLAEPIAAGILRWDDVASLCEVVAGKASGRAAEENAARILRHFEVD
jgi:hypothetical protein